MTDDDLLCVTSVLPDFHPCTLRGEHLDDCWVECDGCAPAPAKHGQLCESCWTRVQKVASEWASFVAMTWGVIRAVTPELPTRPVPGPRLPLSAIQVDVDAVNRLQADRPRDLLKWVASPDGAEQALRFAREARHVMLKHPTREVAHRIESSRCPACRQRTLVYDPPEYVGADARVRCIRQMCGAVQDHTTFERYALIAAQCCRRCKTPDGCTETGCTCHRVAPVPSWQQTARGDFEPYDPTRRDHAQLDPLETLPVPTLRRIAVALEVPRVSGLRKAELVAAIQEARAA